MLNSSISTLLEYPNYFHGRYDKKWSCIVRHFEGGIKPWHVNCREYGEYKTETLFFDEFWFYAEMTDFFAGMNLMFKLYNR